MMPVNLSAAAPPWPDSHLRAIVDTVPTQIWSARSDGTVDFLNRRWLEYTGLTAEDALDRGWTAAVHQNDQSRLLGCLRSIVESGMPRETEVRLRRADGEYRWFLFQGHPLTDASGAIVGWCGTNTDIDDQRRAIDSLPGFVCTNLADGSVERVNDTLLRYTGRTQQELKDWQIVVHPEDMPEVARRWMHSVQTGDPFDVDVRVQNGDGGYRWFHCRGLPFRDADGRIIRWYNLLTDIHDRKRAQDALRTREREYKAIIDSMPGLVAVWNPAGETEFVNERVLEYFGTDLDELQHWQQGEVIHPDDLPRVTAAWRHAIATGEPYESEHRLRRRDGEYRWFHVRAVADRDGDGHIIRWPLLITDVHDRRRAEDALRRSERFLLEVQSVSRTAGWRLDLRTGAVESSPELHRAYGGQPGDDVSNPEFFLSRIHPDDQAQVRATLERCIREKIEYRADCRIVRADGSLGFQHARGRPVPDETGEIVEFVGAAMDMTEHWLAATELERASQALRDMETKLSRAAQVATVGELAASIAHEVNQPLASVVANGHACVRWLQHSPPNVARALEAAERTVRDGKDAGEVVRRIRTLFKRATTERVPVDLGDVVRDVMRLVEADATQRSVEIVATLDPQGPRVLGDRVQLQQLVLNLMLNALEAVDPIVDRRKQLAIRSTCGDNSDAMVEVTDNGMGLDDVHAAFEPFYTTKTSGMGMGLAICRSIATAHKGTLTANRNDGFGTTFRFVLPIESAGRDE